MNSKKSDIHPFQINSISWILIGVFIRLLVIPFTFHGDMIWINTIPHLLSHGEWDVYKTAKDVLNQNYYPPMALIFFGLVQLFLRTISTDYEQFTHNLIVFNIEDILAFHSLFKILFLLKLPYLIFDGLSLALAAKLLQNSIQKSSFILFWVLNPVSIYGTYMVGQFDLIPSSLVFLAFYCCSKRGLETYAPLALATGCLFKIFPIVFLPMVTLIIGNNFKSCIRYLFIGVFPVVAFYMFFYLTSGPSVLKLFSDMSYNTDITFDFKTLLLRSLQALTYALVCWHIFQNNKAHVDLNTLSQYFLIIYFAVFWGLYIQWTHYLIWLMPFLIFYAIESNPRKYLYYALLVIIFLAGLHTRSLCFGIFAPLNPDFFSSLPSLRDITGYIFNQKIYDIVIDLLFKGITGTIVFFLLIELFSDRTQKRPTK